MIKNFTCYDNYYYLLKVLPREKRKIMSLAIFEYMFDDIEPNFDDDEQLYGIWINLQMPLNTSKNNIKNGQKGGRPKKPNTKPNDKPNAKPKSEPKTKANNISCFLFLVSNFKYINNNNLLIEKIKEWIKYKQEIKFEYTETGLNSLLKQIDNNCKIYGCDEMINLIDESIANGYKGIIFKNLQSRPKLTNVPEWFEKDIESEKATAEEQQEMNKLLKDFN